MLLRALKRRVRVWCEEELLEEKEGDTEQQPSLEAENASHSPRALGYSPPGPSVASVFDDRQVQEASPESGVGDQVQVVILDAHEVKAMSLNNGPEAEQSKVGPSEDLVGFVIEDIDEDMRPLPGVRRGRIKKRSKHGDALDGLAVAAAMQTEQGDGISTARRFDAKVQEMIAAGRFG